MKFFARTARTHLFLMLAAVCASCAADDSMTPERPLGADDPTEIFVVNERMHGFLVANGLPAPSIAQLGEPREHLVKRVKLAAMDAAALLANHASRLRFLADEDIHVWRIGIGSGDDARPCYYIAVFAKKPGAPLSDLLAFSGGTVTPLRHGAYARALVSIRPGTSMVEAYRRIGIPRPTEYVQDASGRWIVRFVLPGWDEAFHSLSVDGGTGVVVDAPPPLSY